MATTDWQLVRELLAAAVDACEATERLDLTPEDRGLPTGSGADVWDVLTSAWTYPENVRYAVVRARHTLGDDAPFRPELARVVTDVAAVCAELVGARALDAARPMAPGAVDGSAAHSIRDTVRGLAEWYRAQMVPQLTAAAASRRRGDEQPAAGEAAA